MSLVSKALKVTVKRFLGCNGKGNHLVLFFTVGQLRRIKMLILLSELSGITL